MDRALRFLPTPVTANWLVTTWRKPGIHRFTVRGLTRNRRLAIQTTRARVLPAPPPRELAGMWSRRITRGDTGTWHVTINRVGWLFDDPHGREQKPGRQLSRTQHGASPRSDRGAALRPIQARRSLLQSRARPTRASIGTASAAIAGRSR